MLAEGLQLANKGGNTFGSGRGLARYRDWAGQSAKKQKQNPAQTNRGEGSVKRRKNLQANQ